MENNLTQQNTPPASSQENPDKKNDRSRLFRTIAISGGALLLAILIFAGGVVVGLRKARFSYRFGQNYERNFVGMRGHGHMFPWGGDHDFRDPHGLAGTIISLSGNNLVIKDAGGQENTVTITNQTLIKYQGKNLKAGDLKQNEKVVVLGRPSSNGTVSADLVRVFDNLPPGANQNPPAKNNPDQPVVNNAQPASNANPSGKINPQNNNQTNP